MVGLVHHISKIENEKPTSAISSEELIRKLPRPGDRRGRASILAKKIPSISGSGIERPDAFRKIACLDDETLDKLLKELEDGSPGTG